MRTLSLGLALGAGGTKGAAHVGVMRVLEDAGLRAEAVAGTSIGALYGGAYAVGRTPAEMEEGIRACPSREVVSFFRHRLRIRHNNRLARRFYEALAGQYIEHLPVKYAAVASDIVARRAYTITSGPIIDAIEASIAIPIIARPVRHQGRYLLDGGFWDAAPVDAAVALGADVVVAVEIGSPYTLPQRIRQPATWFATRFGGLALRRTFAGIPFAIGATAAELAPGRTANVVLQPRIPRIAGNVPGQMVACLEAGIEAAQQALPTIVALLAGEPVAAVVDDAFGAPRLRADPGLAG